MYCLQDGPDRAFAQEEYMHIAKHNQIPRDWVVR